MDMICHYNSRWELSGWHSCVMQPCLRPGCTDGLVVVPAVWHPGKIHPQERPTPASSLPSVSMHRGTQGLPETHTVILGLPVSSIYHSV